MSEPIVETISIDRAAFGAGIGAWFVAQANALAAKAGPLDTLLVHTLDGVAWGHIKDGHVTWSGDVFPVLAVPIHAETLLQARLFGAGGELFVWRTGADLRARLLADTTAAANALPDEYYYLWGDHCERAQNGFSLLADGRQGLRHAPPLVKVEDGMRARLHVRHYVQYDANRAYIGLSRLTGLSVAKPGKVQDVTNP